MYIFCFRHLAYSGLWVGCNGLSLSLIGVTQFIASLVSELLLGSNGRSATKQNKSYVFFVFVDGVEELMFYSGGKGTYVKKGCFKELDELLLLILQIHNSFPSL